MINILIVEDNPYKLETIRKLLIEELMIDPSQITSSTDIKAAKRKLMGVTYDLLILDLVLPLEAGDTPSPEKGIGFLTDLDANPNINSPIHIIGLTEFSDLKTKFQGEFEKYVWYLIDYNATEFNWQEKLKSVVYHLLSVRTRFFDFAHKQMSFDVAVITALNKPEFEKILDWPVEWDAFSLVEDPVKYYQTVIEKNGKSIKVVAACVGHMGMTATSVLSTKMIGLFKPKFIFMSGICAGIRERGLHYGDVLIAEQSWDYGSGKMKESQESGAEIREAIFEPDPRPISLSPTLVALVNSFLRRDSVIANIQASWRYAKPSYALKALLGPVASGSYVISSQIKLDEIKHVQHKLLGVEMEGYGLYYACAQHDHKPVKALLVKSVADFGDASKDDNFQEYSSYTSAQFIYHFLLEEVVAIC